MNMQEYGGLIREYRKKHHLSQQELGDCVNLSRATISLIETGAVVDIGARKLSRVCDRLGLVLQIIPRQTPTLDSLLKANSARRIIALNATSAILTGKAPRKTRTKKSHA
jgi:transcriptional regulator with XRE-family HTH domain